MKPWNVLLAGMVGVAVMAVLAGCLGRTGNPDPSFDAPRGVNFVIQNLTAASMTFQLSVDGVLRNDGEAYFVAAGATTVILVEDPCPTRIEFLDIRYRDLFTSGTLQFDLGPVTALAGTAVVLEDPDTGEPVSVTLANPMFACPASFQITALSETDTNAAGELRVAILQRVPTSGGVVTPTPIERTPRPLPSITR